MSTKKKPIVDPDELSTLSARELEAEANAFLAEADEREKEKAGKNSGEPKKNKTPEEIIDGQITMEDYLFSLNPVFNISCADLIEVHP